MLSFLAMILTFRLGLGSTPVDQALVSLREEAATVAAEQVGREPLRGGATARVMDPGTSVEGPQHHVLAREDWVAILTDTLSNQTLANAAMWVANQPVSVSMSGEKFFVSVRIATP